MAGSQTAGQIRHEATGHILTITIDNPAKRNAFVPEMMQ
jgi:enoyl-CoA hydratase/carnithine racemase